jgi:hypothetical protein
MNILSLSSFVSDCSGIILRTSIPEAFFLHIVGWLQVIPIFRWLQILSSVREAGLLGWFFALTRN